MTHSKTCNDCFFYVFRPGHLRGECRRYPPTVMTHRNRKGASGNEADWRDATVYPLVSAIEWCGEFVSQALGDTEGSGQA